MEPREYLVPTMTEFRLGTGNPPEPIDTSWLSAVPRHVVGEMIRPAYSYTVSLPRSRCPAGIRTAIRPSQ